MPRRGLPGAGLFGEHVIVIQARRRALHQAARGLGEGRLDNESAIVRIFSPIAKILDETARVSGAAGHFGTGAQGGEVQIYAGAQLLHLMRPE